MTSTKLAPRPGIFGRWPFELSEFFRWPEGFFGVTGHKPMCVEEYVEDGHFVVRAELPGLDPDKDINVRVAEGMLFIEAERKQEAKTEEKGGYHTEMYYGLFSRTIPLPTGVTEKNVTAAYKSGILEVRLPVTDQVPEKGKRVPVTQS